MLITDRQTNETFKNSPTLKWLHKINVGFSTSYIINFHVKNRRIKLFNEMMLDSLEATKRLKSFQKHNKRKQKETNETAVMSGNENKVHYRLQTPHSSLRESDVRQQNLSQSPSVISDNFITIWSSLCDTPPAWEHSLIQTLTHVNDTSCRLDTVIPPYTYENTFNSHSHTSDRNKNCCSTAAHRWWHNSWTTARPTELMPLNVHLHTLY